MWFCQGGLLFRWSKDAHMLSSSLLSCCLLRMVKFCQGGIFFTGMSVNENPIQAAEFEKFQTKQISRIIQKAHKTTPVKLTGEKYKAEASKFMVFETAAKDSLTLLRILPELKKTCVEAVQMRNELLDMSGQVFVSTCFPNSFHPLLTCLLFFKILFSHCTCLLEIPYAFLVSVFSSFDVSFGRCRKKRRSATAKP